jgi:protocatechuate 3,4-dioxygenase beta subunit
MKTRIDVPEFPFDPSRRTLVRALLGIPLIGLAGCTAEPFAQGRSSLELPPTLACGDDDDDPTPSQTEGPYFTRNSPERASLLETGLGGTRLVLTGQVLSTSCNPVGAALLDFWQADADGEYDNRGYRLRGHQFTDAEGRFRLETVVPGLYTGRTRHIHVKVQAPNSRVLTTQLYFPGEAQNARDRIYSPKLLMALAGEGGQQRGMFNFVVRT